MDRSHTMISMRDGGLRLALPTQEYARIVREAEEEARFEEKICGPLSYTQRHARFEALVESHVWKHIWKNDPYHRSDHSPMSTRSWRYASNLTNRPVSASRDPASATHFASDNLYCHRRRTQASPINPAYTSTGHQHILHYGPPHFKQTPGFLRSGMPYAQVPNTPDFQPSAQRRDQFPTQTYHPPIGTGRPSSCRDDFPAKDAVSITSRNLRPCTSYSNPFANSSRPCLKPAQQQEEANSAIDDLLYAPPQRRTSGACPNSRAITRELAQHGVPVRNDFQARKGSVSFCRASHGERHDRCTKIGDSLSSGGISKKRRNSSQRKATAAAHTVAPHSDRHDSNTESNKVNHKKPQRSWAQVASCQIKEEPTEDNVTLYVEPLPASVPIKQENDEDESLATWAKVAAAAWLEKKLIEQQVRNDSFGKPLFQFGKPGLGSKDHDAKVEVKEKPEEDPIESPTVQTNQTHEQPENPSESSQTAQAKQTPGIDPNRSFRTVQAKQKREKQRRGHLAGNNNWQLPRTRGWGRCGRLN